MPYETRAKVERERDDMRDALEAILDRVTGALGIEPDEDEGEDDGEEDE